MLGFGPTAAQLVSASTAPYEFPQVTLRVWRPPPQLAEHWPKGPVTHRGHRPRSGTLQTTPPLKHSVTPQRLHATPGAMARLSQPPHAFTGSPLPQSGTVLEATHDPL